MLCYEIVTLQLWFWYIYHAINRMRRSWKEEKQAGFHSLQKLTSTLAPAALARLLIKPHQNYFQKTIVNLHNVTSVMNLFQRLKILRSTRKESIS